MLVFHCLPKEFYLEIHLLFLQEGWYVTLHIVDVPPSVIESFETGKPLVLVSLLPHEQKVLTAYRIFEYLSNYLLSYQIFQKGLNVQVILVF